VHYRNFAAILLLSVMASGAVACGSSSPSSPSGLTSQGGLGGGATINGIINGQAAAGLASTGAGLAALSPSSLTVEVVGTSITAPVRPNGTFVLTDVPPGDIQLHFTGAGTDAMLTVSGVNGGDELKMKVDVNGTSAVLQEISRKDKTNKIEIEGSIASGACASFVVNGTTVTTDAATQFSKGTCANAVVGALVKVKGSVQPDGTVRASDVRFEKAEDTQDENDDENEDKNKIELEGLVTAGACGSFTVRNVVVTTNAATVFKNGRCDEIGVGVRVHVRGTRTGAATALATLVNVQRDADDSGKAGDKESKK
jgi:hypothetical protein